MAAPNGDQIAVAQRVEVEPDARGAELRRLVRGAQAGEVLGGAEQALVPEGVDHGVGVGGHLVRLVRVHARAQGRARLEPHVDHGIEHAVHAEAAQRRRGLGCLGARLLGRAQVGGHARRREARQVVELGAVLGGEHPGRHVAALLRDGRRLAGERRQLRGVRVVLAGEHEPAEVEPPEAPEDLGARVGAAEADQEQLGDLALDRKPAHEVGDVASRRGPGGRRPRPPAHRDDLREERGLLQRPARPARAAPPGLTRPTRAPPAPPQTPPTRARRVQRETERTVTAGARRAA